MKTALLLLAVVWLGLAGCAGSFRSLTDVAPFEVSPVVVKRSDGYALQWRYGSDGFFFAPEYVVRDGAVFFGLRGTSSSGNLRGQTGELPIREADAVAALERGGAFWRNADGPPARLRVITESGASTEVRR